MELLDRYLQAVKKHLPNKRQDDIIAELRANLEAQLEDKESELGRPLNQQEAEEWLKSLGHPMLMAAKYQPMQYLIGPGIFPIYWYVLRLVLLWGSVMYALVSAVIVPLTTHDATRIVGAVFAWPGVLLTMATWVTLIFVVVELVARNNPGKIPQFDGITKDWQPSTLPPLEKEQAPGTKARSYVAAVAEVVFGFLALAWLLLIPKHPFLLMGPGIAVVNALPYQLAPVWTEFYWCILALCIIQLGWQCISLVTDNWRGPRVAYNIVTKVLGLIPLGLLLTTPDHLLFVLKNPGADMERYGKTLFSINEGTHWGLTVVGVIVVLQLIWDVVQAVLAARRRDWKPLNQSPVK
jgi:hypothetical protein